MLAAPRSRGVSLVARAARGLFPVGLVAEQAAATPGAQLKMLDGYDHNPPPEVIAPILIDFFGADR